MRVRHLARGEGGRDKKLLKDGDAEAFYAYFCFRRMHWEPSRLIEMDINERAATIAFIRKWIKDEKEEAKKNK